MIGRAELFEAVQRDAASGDPGCGPSDEGVTFAVAKSMREVGVDPAAALDVSEMVAASIVPFMGVDGALLRAGLRTAWLMGVGAGRRCEVE